MADNYLLFSEATPQLTLDELAWFRSQLETVYVVGGQELTEEDDIPANAKIEWTGPRAFRDLPDFEEGDPVGFDYDFYDTDQDRSLWFQSSDWGNVYQIAHLMQKFLKAFRPRESWALTYATTCSKPRVGEFGGGAVFVTADRIRRHNAHDLIERWQKTHQRRLAKLDTAQAVSP